ncbi:restriction endonuclease subunit S [Saprospira grandis]|uniref:restriction endonuclease subunit S n=1 Tax=Saprospira grandis TaxID=1008 RepID=UPI0022DCF4A5|nr:restriction endonuclease subunit S [Saprospira grandis]WBM74387.1 restriction endonuclease subunit S [Saprospira grandis]
MKRYSAYKETAVEWIGEIPEHWEVTKMKYTNKIIMGQSPSSDDYIFEPIAQPFLQGNAEFGSKYPSPKVWCDNVNKSAEKGDILISVRAPVGALNIANQKYGIGRGLAAIRADMHHSQYLYYYLYSLNDYLNSLGTGSTFKAISTTDVGNIVIPIIPEMEQQQIVAYLDKKTAQLDRLLGLKEEKIKLLQEKRTALINQVVTKGLDRTVTMKDSGVEWIGEIPEGWEKVRMKFLCDITTGAKDTKDREDDGLYPFFVRSQTIEKINTFSFDGEGILTAGDGVGVGKVFHHYIGKFDFHQRVYLLYNFKRIIGRYLYLYMKNNFLKTVENQNAKSTVDSLRMNMLQDFTVVLPPKFEQQQIITYLDQETAKIDHLIRTEAKKIALLKAYRQSLISEVVTGKKRVADCCLELEKN